MMRRRAHGSCRMFLLMCDNYSSSGRSWVPLLTGVQAPSFEMRVSTVDPRH